MCEVGERKSVHVYTHQKKGERRGRGRERKRDAHMLVKSKSGGEKQRETDSERACMELSQMARK